MLQYYQIALTITVVAESDDEARSEIGQFLSAALVGEPGPIKDYSIEETQDVYGDARPDGEFEQREAYKNRLASDGPYYCPSCGADLANPCGCIQE